MKKLYQKSELIFAIVWIVAYCVLLSVGDNLSENIGISKAVTFPISAVLSVMLFVFIKKNGLMKKYGFCKSAVSSKRMIFYVPLLLMLTVNLWYGVSMNLSAGETVLYILSMLCVGFLEEVIFRGLLFRAMAKDDIRSAVIVSSITFGIGHIINLINGSGAELTENILQVIYAVAAGFMFVMIYFKSESLISCIVTHGIFNALSVFSNEAVMTENQRIGSCVFLTVIGGFYAVYLAVAVKRENTVQPEKKLNKS